MAPTGSWVMMSLASFTDDDAVSSPDDVANDLRMRHAGICSRLGQIIA